MIKDYLKLSYTFLKNRKLRSWLTIVGVFIGIAAVVSLIGLGEGLRLVILGQFNFLSTDILTIQASGLNAGPPGQGVVNPLQESYIKDLEQIKGIDMAIGRIIEDTTIFFDGKTDFTFAGSMPDGEKGREVARIAQFEIDKGRLLADHEAGSVVLGNNYGKPDRLGKAIRPRDKVTIQGESFEVAGILKKKGSFIVDNIILINEEKMKDLFSVNDTYDIIAVKIDSGNDMTVVKSRIEDFLRRERDADEGEEDFSVDSPEQALDDLDATLFAIQIFIYVIAGISIIVGGIGIANTTYTSVIERTKQIGIMKSIGARNQHIFILFLIESGLLGLIGGLAGIVIGSGIAYGMAMIGKFALNTDIIQVSISWTLLSGALLFSFIVGSIAGVMPALNASRLPPVEALRTVK